MNDIKAIMDADETISCVKLSLVVRNDKINLENNNVKGISVSCDNLVDIIVKTIYINTDYKQYKIKEIIEKY